MLSIIAAIYEKIAELRNVLYDKDVFDTYDTRVFTISVGNITAGGTGKTPLVAYIANVLADRGEKVGILTRGYGRVDPGKQTVVSDWKNILASPETAGDEPYELAKRLLGRAMIVANADRVSAAEMARRDYGVTTFVLDDAFQHRKVKRDLDIVCIDAADPFGGYKMLPAGRLREPLRDLSRADVIVITRSDQAKDLDSLEAEIRELCPKGQVFRASNSTAGIVGLNEFLANEGSEVTSWDQFESAAGRDLDGDMKATAFCALGNPQSFFDQLSADLARSGKGPLLAETKALRDHHRYTQKDVDALEKLARDSNSGLLVTTAKDAVKLKGLKFTMPCYVVEIEVVIDDHEQFDALL